MPEENRSLSIKELIQQVRRELAESDLERRKEGRKAIFQVEDLTLEVNFIVTHSGKGGGGFSFQVLTLGGANLGGEKAYENQQVHKITLSLKAIPPTETPTTPEELASRRNYPSGLGGLHDLPPPPG
jgi:hypothetical protein